MSLNLYDRHSGIASILWYSIGAIFLLATIIASKRKKCLTILPFLLGCGSLVIYIVFWYVTFPSIATLKEQGTELVDSIENFQAEEGRLPSDLNSFISAYAGWRVGGWKYTVDELDYVLRIGDYSEDLFELSYHSKRPFWRYDT